MAIDLWTFQECTNPVADKIKLYQQSVPVDPTSGKAVPSNAAEWQDLIQKANLAAKQPTHLTLNPQSFRGYQQSVSGWSLKPPTHGFARFRFLDGSPEPTDRVIHDPDCPRGCFYRLQADGVVYRLESPLPPVPVDPLDVKYDGETLRILLARDEICRRETRPAAEHQVTSVQRAAISAHWSAELRSRIEASKQKERGQVTVQSEDD